MDFLATLYARAREQKKRIVFAEGNDARVLEAAALLEKESLCTPILLKDPTVQPQFATYVKRFQEIRGTTLDEATEKMKNAHYFATMLLHEGEADGMIAGPTAASRERILPALELIKTKIEHHKVSGAMLMLLPDTVDPDAANGGKLLFADCAVNIEPTVEVLAQIAIDTAETAQLLGMDPKIALLSFSTAGSTEHPLAKKMKDAAQLIRSQRSDLGVEGELQVDAALMDKVAALKDPGSSLAGHANVLIFPDLEAGNIAYKLVERLAGAKVIGPILQGLKKPMNEVSRGCSVEDIVNLATLTATLE
ncbi:phosphotransacetylase [Candidatus Peregrinibacteria bacterium]|nr:MAG: phosphotransacetylase [Candidatus Peregrinibacteria bacterium]